MDSNDNPQDNLDKETPSTQPEQPDLQAPVDTPVSDENTPTQDSEIAPESPIDEPEAPDTSDTPVASEPEPIISHHASNRSRGKSWLTLVVSLLIIALTGAGAYYFLTRDNGATPAKSVAVVKKDIPHITLTINGSNNLNSFYPDYPGGDYAFIYNFQVFEGLVKYEDETKIAPALATSWSNPDLNTWNFKLRKNVTFHTGRTMTPEDVVASFEQVRKNESLEMFTSTIKDVKAIGNDTVQITTEKQDPFLLNKLTFLYVYDSKADGQPAPVKGTGAYTLKPGTELSPERLDLVAYDKYYGGHAYTRALTFLSTTSEDKGAQDLKDKKTNIAGEFTVAMPPLLKGLNFTTYNVHDTAVNYLLPNAAKTGPLQKKEVRQALQLSIDLPAFLKNTNTLGNPANQMITSAIPGYDPSIKMAQRDITKAKELLTQAGYPNGVTLNLEVMQVNQVLISELAKQAAEAGITLKPHYYTDFDALIDKIMSHNAELSYIGYSSDTYDASDVFSAMLQQTGNFDTPELAKLLDEVASTTDPAKRLSLLQEISRYAHDEVAAIPLVNRTRVWIMDKPYVMPKDMPGAGPGVYFWKVYQQ